MEDPAPPVIVVASVSQTSSRIQRFLESDQVAFAEEFWQGWITRMTAGMSLICPFGALLFDWKPQALWGISVICLIIASYRVWLRQRRKVRAYPFGVLMENVQSLIVDLDRFAEAARSDGEYPPEVLQPGLSSWETADRSERQRLAVVFSHHFIDYCKSLDTAGRTTESNIAMFTPDFRRALQRDRSLIKVTHNRLFQDGLSRDLLQ